MHVVDALQQLLLRLGAGWVLGLLALLSLVSVALTIERALEVLAQAGRGRGEHAHVRSAQGDRACARSAGTGAAQVTRANIRRCPISRAQRVPRSIQQT